MDEKTGGIQGFPTQQLPYAKKGDKWRKQCVDWACAHMRDASGRSRKTAARMRVNIDLVNGRLHVDDMRRVVAPDMRNIGFKPEDIQHYPIINPKLNLLLGEERKRVFEHRVVVTNPNGVSEVERARAEETRRRYETFLGGAAQGGSENSAQMAMVNEFMTYQWQDVREIRANALLDHYSKEQGFDVLFNDGFRDAMTVGEEIYLCDIVCGEPVMTKLDPLSVHVLRHGASNRVEDADIVAVESYWPVGKVVDHFHDSLSESDLRKLDSGFGSSTGDAATEEAYLDRLYNPAMDGGPADEWRPGFAASGMADAPYDAEGNVRVLRVFWKSRKKIVRVKGYDPVTGETVYTVYPEGHKPDESLGEEAKELWVNEAWEGALIGSDIYADVRPRRVQYNRMGDPSRCHFGIIGTMYGSGGEAPFCLVDMMKPYNYLYDVIHDRLNKQIARSWGAIMRLDLAQVPDGWDIEKWLYFAKESGVAVTDSFKEGDRGAAMGKIAGGLNSNNSGVINLNDSASIAQDIQLLQFIQQEMSSVVGISAQREGMIDNRETVGGVERATVQSSHITEWLFSIHNDTKKRAYECFLETAKAAMRGRNMKFQYLLGDGSMTLMEVDGDEFAECDYGLAVDYGNDAQRLRQSIETLAQAALQNQTLNFSTILKLYNSGSLAEKQRLVEKAERDMSEARRQEQRSAMEQQQAAAKAQAEAVRAKAESEERMRAMDNETRVKVAEIEARAKLDVAAMSASAADGSEMAERRRQFDERMDLERRKLDSKERKDVSDAARDDRNRGLDRAQREAQSRRQEAGRREIEEKKIAAAKAAQKEQ